MILIHFLCIKMILVLSQVNNHAYLSTMPASPLLKSSVHVRNFPMDFKSR